GERVVRCQPARPVQRTHRLIQFIRRLDVNLKNRPEDTNRGAQPEIRLIQKRAFPREMHAATTRLHFDGAERAQLIRENRLDAAATGGEIAFECQRAFLFAPSGGCLTMKATNLYPL